MSLHAFRAAGKEAPLSKKLLPNGPNTLTLKTLSKEAPLKELQVFL